MMAGNHLLPLTESGSHHQICDSPSSPWSSSPQPWLSRLSTGSWFPRRLWHTVRTGFLLLPPSSSLPGTHQPPVNTPRRSPGAAAGIRGEQIRMFLKCPTQVISESVNFAYLSNDVVDDFVDGEADVGVDGEHLSQCVFILCGVQVSIQQASHHIQKCWIVLLQLHFTCVEEGTSCQLLPHVKIVSLSHQCGLWLS